MAGKKQKSRMISVRLISMAMTGFYRTFVRPRTKRPLSFIKYDPVGTYSNVRTQQQRHRATPNSTPPGSPRHHSCKTARTVGNKERKRGNEEKRSANTKPSHTVRRHVLFLEQKRGSGNR
ncbi:hypothetical protein BC567DRAFT_59772 [Phyllosticta citribraziliensis]